MSRTIRKNRRTQENLPDKDTIWRCKCDYCFGSKRIRSSKELERTSFRLADEEYLDSSSDLLEFHAPEKEAYLEKHFGHFAEGEENFAIFLSERQSQQNIEELLDKHAPDEN